MVFLGVVLASLLWSTPVYGQVLLREAISREVSVFVGAETEPAYREAISREVSVFVGADPEPMYKEAVSREVSVLVTTEAPPAQVTTLSVSVTPTGHEATLSWAGYQELPQHDLVRYDIYVANHAFTDVTGMTPYTSVPVGTQSVVLEGLPAWQDRYFAVVAVDILGNLNPVVQWRSAYVLAREAISREVSVFVGADPEPMYKEAVSREVSVLVPTDAVPAPVTYQGSPFLAETSSQEYSAIDLNWTHYDELSQHDVMRYRVYIGFGFFDNVAGMTPVAYVPAGTRSYTLKGLHGFGVYHVAVVAEDVLGQFNPNVFSRSALASGRLFSPRDYTSDYVIAFAMDYRLEAESFNLRVWAYDLGLGARVSEGGATYQVTQGGLVLATGMLQYSPTHREWRVQRSLLASPGRLDVQVLINGRSDARWLLVPSPFPVHLTGRVQQDDGTPQAGALVRLYAAETVLSAADLMNLPEPLASYTTMPDGSFDFGGLDPGQYVLILETGSGITVGRAFWLRSGATAHHEILFENPGRTALLIGIAGLKEQIRGSVLETQTEWMRDVTSTVDRDLDRSKDVLDWAILAMNVVSGTASEFSKAWAAGLGAHWLPRIAVAVTAEAVAEEIAVEVAIELSAESKRFVEAQSIVGKASIYEPYYAYGDEQNQELDEFYGGLEADYNHIIDPRMTGTIPIPTFSRDDPVHRVLLHEWLPVSRSYQFAERWLAQYYQDVLADMPVLPSHFSIQRAQRVLAAAEGQLRNLEAGTGNVFISPWPDEVTGTNSPSEPLGLGLADYYVKYASGRIMADVADLVGKGSGIVSIGLNTATAVSAGTVVGIPVAKVTGVASLLVQGVGVGASVWRGTVQHDLAGTYAAMGMKYCVNLGLAPLALKRTADYVLSEASGALYYFDEQKSFDGEIRSVALGGVGILGHEVFFPVQLTYLPFAPPIQFTPVILAEIEVANPSGMDRAEYRVDTRVRDWYGTYDHVVTSAGELQGGDSRRVQAPFRGHLRANAMMSHGVFETRLWTGPFQSTCPVPSPFMVLPVNFGLPPAPGPLAIEEDFHVQSSMREPISFVQSDFQSLTAEDLLAGAERVRDRVELRLATGAHSFSRQYVFGADVFSAQFRLYRSLDTSARMRVEMDGGYIAWNEATDSVHMGLPGEHSGRDGDPEVITVQNVGGQTVTVHVALTSLDSSGTSILLEVWEQPVRNAVMTVLPGTIHSISQPETIHVVELTIGESSHQHPLASVQVLASRLQCTSGLELDWRSVSWHGTPGIPAGGLKTCLLELNTAGVPDGTYTGTVTVSSASAGTVEVPVSITIDGQAPTVTILPVREWWRRATGPVVSWIGQDNMTDEENLRFSKRLTPVDGSWSGYQLVNSRDMTDLSDGEYLLSVVARDQALNVTDPAASILVRIDRDGIQFRQRIVDADPDITDVDQVNWHDDWDGDGVSNWLEFLAGTDPTDPNDVFALTETDMSPTGFVIRWQAKRGVTYQVRRTANLVNGPWVNAPTGEGQDEKSMVTAPVDGELIYRDTSVTGGAMFYKIEMRD